MLHNAVQNNNEYDFYTHMNHEIGLNGLIVLHG